MNELFALSLLLFSILNSSFMKYSWFNKLHIQYFVNGLSNHRIYLLDMALTFGCNNRTLCDICVFCIVRLFALQGQAQNVALFGTDVGCGRISWNMIPSRGANSSKRVNEIKRTHTQIKQITLDITRNQGDLQPIYSRWRQYLQLSAYTNVILCENVPTCIMVLK